MNSDQVNEAREVVDALLARLRRAGAERFAMEMESTFIHLIAHNREGFKASVDAYQAFLSVLVEDVEALKNGGLPFGVVAEDGGAQARPKATSAKSVKKSPAKRRATKRATAKKAR